MLRVNGFFGHVQRKHFRSMVMFAGFALSIQLAFAVLLSTLYPLMLIFNIAPGPIEDLPVFFDDPAAYCKTVSLYIFVLSIGLFAAAYYGHTALTKKATGFRTLQPGENIRLHNITSYLAVTAGIDMPALGIIPTYALNSFACGRNAKTSTIVVTQGLLNELNDDELRAVIAHEIVHIMNGDVKLMAMANASQALVKTINWLNPMQLRGWKKPKWTLIFLPLMIPLIMLIIPLIIIMAILGFVMKLSSVIASVSRYFITSSREFIADAEAVRLTHNPAALISALSKIEGRSQIAGLSPMTDAMMIDGAADGEHASHPPIHERIQILRQYGGSMVHGAAAFMDSRSFSERRPANAQDRHAAQTKYREKTKKGLLERLNAGSKTNIFGLPKRATPLILVAFGLFFGIKMSANQAMSYMPGQLTEQEQRDWVPHVIEYTSALIALDLDGNGLYTQSVHRSSAYFETTPGSPAYKTGWLESSDGFLFLDKNENGRIDGAAELLTVNADQAFKAGGFPPLTELDTNGDGHISKSDSQFKHLKLWRDFGGDGIAEDNEIFSLQDFNITSFNLKGIPMRRNDDQGAVPKPFKVASRTWLLRKGTYIMTRNTRRNSSPTIQRGSFYLVAFQTNLARYRKPDGTLISEAPPGHEKKPLVSATMTPKYHSVGHLFEDKPKLRGAPQR